MITPLSRDQLRTLAGMEYFGGSLRKLRADLRMRSSVATAFGGGFAWINDGTGRQVQVERVELISADLRVLEVMCTEEGIDG